MNLSDDVDLEDFVARPDKISGADIHSICQEAGKSYSKPKSGVRDSVNGLVRSRLSHPQDSSVRAVHFWFSRPSIFGIATLVDPLLLN